MERYTIWVIKKRKKSDMGKKYILLWGQVGNFVLLMMIKLWLLSYDLHYFLTFKIDGILTK